MITGPHRPPVSDALTLAQRENDALAAAIASIEARMPTDEEMAYLRNRKNLDDHAAWLLKFIRTNAPWATVLCTAVGTFVYWALTHTISIGSKP